MHVRRLDEIEDLLFDVTHPPGARNPMDQLLRLGLEDGDGFDDGDGPSHR